MPDKTDAQERWHNLGTWLTPGFRRICAYLLLSSVCILGFWRVETAIDEERKIRLEFDLAEDREEREEAQELIESCKVRNRGTLNGRVRFIRLRDNLLEEFFDDPEAIALIGERLFEGIVFDPELEDRDCNGDGVLDDQDYAP